MVYTVYTTHNNGDDIGPHGSPISPHPSAWTLTLLLPDANALFGLRWHLLVQLLLQGPEETP